MNIGNEKRILFVEPEKTGHHLALYTRLLMQSAETQGWEVQLLTTAEAVTHPAFKLIQDSMRIKFSVFLMRSPTKFSKLGIMGLIANQVSHYIEIRRGYLAIPKKERPSIVFVIDLNGFDKILPILGSPFGDCFFMGILMKIKFHHSCIGLRSATLMDFIDKCLFIQMLNRPYLKKMFVIDELFLEYLDKKNNNISKIVYAPDPGGLIGNLNKHDARNNLEIALNLFVILVYGALSIRKGIESLINGLDSMTNSEKIVIILAGEPDEDTRIFLETSDVKKKVSQGKIVLRLGFQSSVEEYIVFKASDIVWAAYTLGFVGSSGVYYQAASMGLPIVVSKFGLLGYLGKNNKNTVIVDPENYNQVGEAIAMLMQNKQFYKRLSNYSFAISKAHDPAKFTRVITNEFT